MENVIRTLHVVVGFAAIAVGIVSFLANKRGRLHARIGPVYFLLVSAACASAAVLAMFHWSELWPFFAAAIGTYAFACVGFIARRHRTRRGLIVHVVGLTSSFAGMVIAFLVTNFQRITGIADVPFAMRLLPLQFISTCVVIWIAVLVHRGRIPHS